MSTVKSPPTFLNDLVLQITKALKASGIPAKVTFNPVPTTKLFRVFVMAPKFREMSPSERQDLVWRITDQVLTPEQQMRISMILTLAEEKASSKKKEK